MGQSSQDRHGQGTVRDPHWVFPQLSRPAGLPHRYSPKELHAVAVSALLGLGLEELRAQLEDAVLQATGRRILVLRVPLAGAQLRFLGLAWGQGVGMGGKGGREQAGEQWGVRR